MEKKLFNVSSSPHFRSKLNTSGVMFEVILALLPVTCAGIWRHGLSAVLVIGMSIVSAAATEFVFDYIAKKPNTVKDGSCIVTGLLLALCLPAGVPLYVPFLGALFAILFVKCLFGGIGKNFMNPALAGRCFLLISFSSVMTSYSIDGVTSATPLADMAAGETVSVTEMLFGLSNGVIGSSILGLVVGGLFLWILGGITFEIPVAALGSFVIFVALFGGRGFDPMFILAHVAGGGIVMGAIFMATDPVTSPVTSSGQLVFGALVGILAGLFRIFGSAADSVSYAIIISNLFVPFIDEYCVPVPYGYRRQSKEKVSVPKSAVILCVITLIAGVALSGVFGMTRDTIAQQEMAANAASYQEVCPDATEFAYDDEINAAIEALGGEIYGTNFGKAYINEMVVGKDASGNVAGYVISVTSGDGFEGNITLALGLQADGTVNGISFTELNETAGMGSLCGEDAFKSQFNGVKTDQFTLNKAGGSTADNEIDSVSGASTSSGAIVNAVNAALDFFAANVQ